MRVNNTITRTGVWSTDQINLTNFSVAIHFGPDANTKMLTLPIAGYRQSSDGTKYGLGFFGFYSTSQLNTDNSPWLFTISEGATAVNSVAPSSGSDRLRGHVIRCIAE